MFVQNPMGRERALVDVWVISEAVGRASSAQPVSSQRWATSRCQGPTPLIGVSSAWRLEPNCAWGAHVLPHIWAPHSTLGAGSSFSTRGKGVARFASDGCQGGKRVTGPRRRRFCLSQRAGVGVAPALGGLERRAAPLQPCQRSPSRALEGAGAAKREGDPARGPGSESKDFVRGCLRFGGSKGCQ